MLFIWIELVWSYVTLAIVVAPVAGNASETKREYEWELASQQAQKFSTYIFW